MVFIPWILLACPKRHAIFVIPQKTLLFVPVSKCGFFVALGRGLWYNKKRFAPE
jgi:hypothetical protein